MVSWFFRIFLPWRGATRYQSPISVREIATIDNLNEEREGPDKVLHPQVQSHHGVTGSLLFIIIVAVDVAPMWLDYPLANQDRFLLYRRCEIHGAVPK